MATRYEYLSDFELFSFKVLSVGFSSNTEITRSTSARPTFIIHYVTDGVGYLNNHKVVKGQGFIIPPNKFASYYPDKEQPWSFFWIILSGSSYQGMKKIFNEDENDIFTYHFDSLIKQLGEIIVKTSYDEYDDSNVWEIFNAILTAQIKEGLQKKRKRKISTAEYAKKIIDINFHQNIRIDDICKNLFVSQSYLYREFYKKYGVSPKDYLTQKKLNHALYLLRNTNDSISNIGLSIGFNDVLAFSSFFKKHTGLSPTKYRQENNLKQ